MVAQIAWPNKGLPNKYLTTHPRALSLPMGWNRNKRWGFPCLDDWRPRLRDRDRRPMTGRKGGDMPRSITAAWIALLAEAGSVRPHEARGSQTEPTRSDRSRLARQGSSRCKRRGFRPLAVLTTQSRDRPVRSARRPSRAISGSSRISSFFLSAPRRILEPTTRSVSSPHGRISWRGFTPPPSRPASPQWSAIPATIFRCGAM